VRAALEGIRCRVSAAFRPGDTPRTPDTRHQWRFVAALLLIAMLAPSALACPVCWGAPDDPMVKGVNNGIWVLLGLVALVQIGFVALFWSFWRRGRELRRFRESLRVIEGGPHA
jgi:hypothetical protein